MLHPLNHYAIAGRLERFRQYRKAAQLKRGGYREQREPRVEHHWANR